MTIYKPQHRLLLDYNIVCPICGRVFYSKKLNVKYCSEYCREVGRKLVQHNNHKRWRDKNREYLRQYQRNLYAINKLKR